MLCSTLYDLVNQKPISNVQNDAHLVKQISKAQGKVEEKNDTINKTQKVKILEIRLYFKSEVLLF